MLQHLAEQRERIGTRDPELIATIAAIEQQEREHRDHGVALAAPSGLALRVIDRVTSRATAAAIALSMRL